MTAIHSPALPTIEHDQTAPASIQQILAGKKIIFVFHSLGIGGAETQAIHLAAFLKNHIGAHVEIWAFSPPGPAAALCDRHDLPHRSLPYPLAGNPLQKLLGLCRFAKELRRAHPTIVLPYTMAQNIICALTWRLGGAKLCVWNQRDEGRARASRLIEALALRSTPLFISNSTHGADFLANTAGALQDRIHIVPNGVAPMTATVDRKAWRRQHHIPPDTFLACMVANLHRYKDHATLLRAWRLVLDSWNHPLAPKLLLAGRKEDTARSLERLAAELQLGNTLQFLGPVQDVPSLLHAADLCVFSSRCEGCPNGILESMNAGLPVVATDIPGIREALGPACDEVLAPPNDPTTLARHITRMAADARWRNHHATANRNRVAQSFGVQRMCEQTASLLARALQTLTSDEP